MNSHKPVRKSKTVWVNGVLFAVALLGLLAGHELFAEYAVYLLLVQSIINLGLRFFTTQPILASRAKQLILFPLLALAMAGTSHAQIKANANYDLHEPIVLACESAAKEGEALNYLWNLPPQANTIKVNGGRDMHVWAPSGRYVARLVVVRVNWMAQTIDNEEYSHTFVVGTDPGPGPTPPVTTTADMVAVVYESDDTGLPKPYVTGALNELKAKGLEVRLFDDDVTTGDGKVPTSIAPIIKAARKNGLPALVVMSKGKIVKAVNLPATKEEIVRLAQ